MELMIIILKKHDKLDTLLAKFADNGVRGATILDSTGMGTALAANHDDDEFLFLGSLRQFLNQDRETSKTILMVVKDEQVETVKNIVNEVVGDLTKPNTGILFTTPISHIYGGSFTDNK